MSTAHGLLLLEQGSDAKHLGAPFLKRQGFIQVLYLTMLATYPTIHPLTSSLCLITESSHQLLCPCFLSILSSKKGGEPESPLSCSCGPV